jgi:hypothetical protein
MYTLNVADTNTMQAEKKKDRKAGSDKKEPATSRCDFNPRGEAGFSLAFALACLHFNYRWCLVLSSRKNTYPLSRYGFE